MNAQQAAQQRMQHQQRQQQQQQAQRRQAQAQAQAQQAQQPRPSLADTIHALSIQNGLHLSPECAYTMAPNVEYHLREVIQEACKFMRHSKRGTLAARDVNHALRSMGIEQLYGFFSSEPLRFEKVPSSKGGLYAVHDPIISLDSIVEQPLPACPREPTLKAHWMAIEGVQPAIPENPTAVEESAAKAASTISGQTADPPSAAAGEEKQGGAAAAAAEAAGVKVVPLVRDVLSKELQLFYDTVTDGILNGSAAQQAASLNSLSSDAGLHLLVPYFTLFVSDKVVASLKNLGTLTALMRTTRALLTNPHICLEPYVHQLIPAVLTCVVGKRLCADGLTEDHWALRDYAAELVALICEQYGPAYSTLQPRITKTLLGGFVNPARPLVTHYGAVVALSKLGPMSIHNLVLPNLKTYMVRLEPELNDTKQLKRLEANKVFSALLNCAGLYISRYWHIFDPPTGSAQHAATPSLAAQAAAAASKKRKKKTVLSQYAVPPPAKAQKKTETSSAAATDDGSSSSGSSSSGKEQSGAAPSSTVEAGGASSPAQDEPQAMATEDAEPAAAAPKLPTEGGTESATSAPATSAGVTSAAKTGSTAIGPNGLPTQAVPYEELYALFGDKLMPFLPTSTAV